MQGEKKRLLSRDDIEHEHGLSRRWLELAALRGDGPPMRKISARMVRYEREEFEGWLKARRVVSTSDARR
jgi:predicted DNA-binding transcriptional regulator AlpA